MHVVIQFSNGVMSTVTKSNGRPTWSTTDCTRCHTPPMMVPLHGFHEPPHPLTSSTSCTICYQTTKIQWCKSVCSIGNKEKKHNKTAICSLGCACTAKTLVTSTTLLSCLSCISVTKECHWVRFLESSLKRLHSRYSLFLRKPIWVHWHSISTSNQRTSLGAVE